MKEALDIEVHGIVQGVGFRPFIYKIARRHLINGWVLNATAGVFIHAEGESKDIDDFVMEISDNAPAASRVDEILMKEVPLEDFESFTIRYSDEAEAEATTLVSPDLATCDECAAELFDPANRRYHYPFINCTNCGPRFTIINKLPYDRKYTSMAAFPMCEQCATEYADPEDRRFHAQPDACFECGPHLIWRTVDHNANAQEDLERVKAEESSFAENGTVKEGRIAPFGVDLKASDAIIDAAVRILRVGGIVAIKGLGGFHLACDARNREALATLRARKRRGTKPLAAMYPTLDALREDCLVSNAEERLLTGAQRPIVLLKKRVEAHFAEGLADGLSELGAMLPYTPLQHLLLTAFGGPLVMTSGNLHDEPIQTDDDKAFVALHDIADAFVGNNRPIRCRFDDSVVRVIKAGSAGEAVQMVRRARGYAPMPVPLKREAEKDGAQSVTFAAGPEQKNTFCLLRGEEAFVSQHIGDLENAPTYDAWLEAKNHYETLFEAQPENIACDLHPEYLASKWAATAHENGTPLCKVQHHHAHIAAVMAENNLDEAVIGVAFDGTGYGADGAIWGGEVMLCNRSDYERFANFSYLPLPGGAAAIKNPLRMAYAALWQYDLLDHPAAARVVESLGEAAEVCDRMIERGINCPMTSSAGRLLDAVSALLGVCEQPTYEGESAILLEAAAGLTDESYEIALVKNTATEQSTAHDTSVILLDAEPLFKAVLDDMQADVPVATIAAKVHNAMIAAIVQSCLVANAAYGISIVALAGGVFMNRLITEGAIAALEGAGFTVALGKELPPNDGAISYGQAAVAAARANQQAS
ncbi:carbamoyltransferase HypF [Slackia piriformis]|uniref:carbamoyltransferase HypF n=1 Tax=Slackia piriformis TaxID=626934 RepID=UPI0023F02BE8|nr:carbamoyltransferase HypF [Slackia piriformis]